MKWRDRSTKVRVIERNLRHHNGSMYHLIKAWGVTSEKWIFGLMHTSVIDSSIAMWFQTQDAAHRELTGKREFNEATPG